jgi:hypothetical protein
MIENEHNEPVDVHLQAVVDSSQPHRYFNLYYCGEIEFLIALITFHVISKFAFGCFVDFIVIL